MPFRSFLFLLFLLILNSDKLSGQNFHFRRYTTEEGLLVNTIYGVAQDKEGIMWIATFNGLNRFNGSSFEIIRNQKRENELIQGNEVLGLFIDSRNRIWAGTAAGLSCFRYLDNKAMFFKPDTSSEVGLPGNIVYRMAETPGKIWLGTNKGLAWFDESSGVIHKADHPILSHEFIKCLVAVNGKLLVGTSSGLYEYIIKSGKWYHRVERLGVIDVCGGDNNDLFVLLQNKRLIRINSDLSVDSLITSGLSGLVKSMTTDSRKCVWIGTSEGLVRFNLLSGKVSRFNHDEFDERSLSWDNLTQVFRDRSGAIWVSTMSGGINIFDPDIENFELIRSPMYRGRGVFNNVISSFTTDPAGRVYIGNAQGLTIWDKEKPEIKNFTIGDIGLGQKIKYWVRSLATDKAGLVWVATAGNGILVLNESQQAVKVFTRDTTKGLNSLPSNYVYSLNISDRGTVYASTLLGVGVMRPGDKGFSDLSRDSFYKEIRNVTVWRVKEDHEGRLLVSVPSKGVYRFDKQKGIVTLFGTGDEAQVQITDKPVWSMYEDSFHQLWFGTNQGITICNEAKNQVRNFSTANGFPDDVIYGFLEDANHHIWMSSNRGIIRYNPEADNFVHYSIGDGLQSNEFNQEAFYKSPDGLMYFGGVKGFNYFDPLKIGIQRQAPVCLITDVSIQSGQKKKFLQKEGLPLHELRYLNDILTIEFSITDFYRIDKAQFRYKLSELDENWIYCGRFNKAIYSNLPPGEYHFQVQSSINGTDWSAAPAELVFAIRPPFYRTWWFVTLLILMLLLFTYFLYRLRVNQIRRQAKISLQMGELKMQALRAQMNPHFIFNSLNSIQHLVLKNDTEQAFSYLSKFSRLLRMILETSDKSFVKLEKELEILQLYLDLERLRFDNQLNIQFDLQDPEDWNELKIPTLLLQPYVENAIWHGLLPKQNNRKLCIRIQVKDEYIWIEIEDNGIGRKRSEEIKSLQPVKYESKSMHINQTRLNLLHERYRQLAQIKISDIEEFGEVKGTLVSISIPIQALLYE